MDKQERRLFQPKSQRRQKHLRLRGQPSPGPQARKRGIGVESPQVYSTQHTEVVIATHTHVRTALDKADTLLGVRAVANYVSENP